MLCLKCCAPRQDCRQLRGFEAVGDMAAMSGGFEAVGDMAAMAVAVGTGSKN